MRQSTLSVLTAGLTLLLCSGCGNEMDPLGPSPTERENFIAVLNGSNVVAPVDTRATGTATFAVERAADGPDETFSISYSVSVTGAPGILGVQMNAGASGQNGEMIYVLCGDGAASCGASGRLAAGSIESSHFRISGITIQDLRDRMRAGTAYVSVLTGAHPAGEIRGQLRQLSAPCGFGGQTECD